MLYTAEVRPLFGSWLDFSITRNDVITVRIDRRRKYAATTFLRAIGISNDEEIYHLFSENDKEREFISATIEKDPTKTKEEAIMEIYRKMRPGEPTVLDNAQELLKNLFLIHDVIVLGSVGRYKMNKKLGVNLPNDTEHWIF